MKAFVKSNYEKLVALLLPLGALGAIAAMAPSPNMQLIEQAEEMIQQPIRQPSPLGIVCLLTLAENPPPPIDLNGERPLFGPSKKWTSGLDYYGCPSNLAGGRLLINGITPLFTRIRLQKVQATSSYTRYRFEIETQESSIQTPRKTYATASLERPDRRRNLTVKEVLGDPEAPDRIILEIEGITGNVGLSPESPYSAIRGYEAELSYPEAGATFPGVCRGGKITVDGESYEALVINPERVILKALRNGKRYHLETNREQRTKNLAVRTERKHFPLE